MSLAARAPINAEAALRLARHYLSQPDRCPDFECGLVAVIDAVLPPGEAEDPAHPIAVKTGSDR